MARSLEVVVDTTIGGAWTSDARTVGNDVIEAVGVRWRPVRFDKSLDEGQWVYSGVWRGTLACVGGTCQPGWEAMVEFDLRLPSHSLPSH